MLAFHTFDVFTDRPFAGNPLAIVRDADALTTEQMQTIAREFNLSETIFVRSPSDPAHTAEVRIFFPTAEIPFAGHPTIGCAIHLAEEIMGEGTWRTEITLEEQAGLVPVQVWREDGQTRAEFTAPIVPHAPTSPPPTPQNLTSLAAEALGLPEASIGLPGHTPAVWSGGPSFLYVPLRSLGDLAQARPHEPAWTTLMEAYGVDSAYLYTPGDSADYQARMFSPAAGIPEDPATGSASAILAAQLLSAAVLPDGTTALKLRQGVEMGRPSEIGLTVDVADGAITAVRIAGTAQAISSGQVRVPSA